VLDNLEQLPGIGGFIVDVLGAARGVKIVGTSRVPLLIVGATEIVVPPLELPAESSPDAIERSPATALFLARACDIRPLDALDDDTARAIVELVRRLAGCRLQSNSRLPGRVCYLPPPSYEGSPSHRPSFGALVQPDSLQSRSC
jgi:predicted ATPase